MKLSCRLCSSNELVEMINLGDQPVAHRILSTPNDREINYPFVVHFCNSCGLIQICNPIDPKELYLDYNYCFSSWKAEPHMDREVETILAGTHGNSVLEIACNDGKFLQALKGKGKSLLFGIEPNPFASQKAREKGFTVYSEMLNESLCKKIVDSFGKFETVVARQVLEHLLDIENFFSCVDILLSEDGFLFIDIPDVGIALSMGDCSVLWEEHVNYFKESVIKSALLRFGFQSVAVERYTFSGMTLAILAKRTAIVVNNQFPDGLTEHACAFNQKLNKYRQLLERTLSEHRRKQTKVVLYGVGCRACTVVNGLNLGRYIDFAIDDQPERQNKYMPGSKLPIRTPDVLKDSSNPIICLLAVNQENESIVKQKMKNNSSAKIKFVSLFSPKNIWLELEKLSK